MATTTEKKKIKDFFNPISNPSGGLPMGMQTTTPATLSALFGAKKKPNAFIESLVYPGGTPTDPRSNRNPKSEAFIEGLVYPGGKPNVPNQSVLPPEALSEALIRAEQKKNTPAGGTGTPLFAGGGTAGAPAPTAPGTEGTGMPSSWMNPDGTIKTPEEIASNIGTTLKNAQGTGDVGRMAAAEFGAPKTEEQLRAEAMQLNNARNDIASGETDPFKVAADSGVSYTPEELSAIEKSYAGIYDPALTTALAKVETKAAENESNRQFEQGLQTLAVKHGYDLEAMAKSHEYDMMIQSMKATASGSGAAGGMTEYSDERSQRAVQSIDELMGQVNGWTTGWGSLLSSVPATDAKSFQTQLNTLKSAIAFNELTAMREASKTGGALGNVSNIELGLLESALAGLDSAQSPADFRTQLTKAKDSINRWRAAQGAAPIGTAAAPVTEQVTVAPNGDQVILTD